MNHPDEIFDELTNELSQMKKAGEILNEEVTRAKQLTKSVDSLITSATTLLERLQQLRETIATEHKSTLESLHDKANEIQRAVEQFFEQQLLRYQDELTPLLNEYERVISEYRSIDLTAHFKQQLDTLAAVKNDMVEAFKRELQQLPLDQIEHALRESTDAYISKHMYATQLTIDEYQKTTKALHTELQQHYNQQHQALQDILNQFTHQQQQYENLQTALTATLENLNANTTHLNQFTTELPQTINQSLRQSQLILSEKLDSFQTHAQENLRTSLEQSLSAHLESMRSNLHQHYNQQHQALQDILNQFTHQQQQYENLQTALTATLENLNANTTHLNQFTTELPQTINQSLQQSQLILSEKLDSFQTHAQENLRTSLEQSLSAHLESMRSNLHQHYNQQHQALQDILNQFTHQQQQYENLQTALTATLENLNANTTHLNQFTTELPQTINQSLQQSQLILSEKLDSFQTHAQENLRTSLKQSLSAHLESMRSNLHQHYNQQHQALQDILDQFTQNQRRYEDLWAVLSSTLQDVDSHTEQLKDIATEIPQVLKESQKQWKQYLSQALDAFESSIGEDLQTSLQQSFTEHFESMLAKLQRHVLPNIEVLMSEHQSTMDEILQYLQASVPLLSHTLPQLSEAIAPLANNNDDTLEQIQNLLTKLSLIEHALEDTFRQIVQTINNYSQQMTRYYEHVITISTSLDAVQRNQHQQEQSLTTHIRTLTNQLDKISSEQRKELRSTLIATTIVAALLALQLAVTIVR